MKRLLVVGAIPDHKHGLRYGGATVLMDNFIQFLQSESVNFKFVQTNKFSNLKTGEKRHKMNKIYFIVRFLLLLPWCDIVMFNFSDSGVCSVFPYLAKIAKLLCKKVVLRKFGGSFDLYFSTQSQSTKGKVIQALNSCDLIFFETKAGIAHLKSLIGDRVRIEWFPNVRNRSQLHKDSSQFNKKLGFLSLVSDEKGIGDVLQMAKQLTPEYQIDIYGYIGEAKYFDYDWSAHNVTYHGEISSEKVSEVLRDLHFLLLPSYREGYPGIIIESMSVGVPVVATKVGGIPEMITDGVEGILVDPGDFYSAVNRIKATDLGQYQAMSKAAIQSFENKFESISTNNRILNLIEAI